MRIAEIGALPAGGCCRLALTVEDGQARDLFVSWCKDAGCEVVFDEVGNIYARRHGEDRDLPAVATGSHLDTQPHGGKFDGIYGVLAGLEVIQTLNDHNIKTKHAIDVVVWTNEEAARFHPPLMGSSVFVGSVATDYTHRIATTNHSTVAQDLKNIGYLGSEVPGSRPFDCFVEAHIEQGPILEAEQKTIGIVTGVQGLRLLAVTVTGEDGHAGTTPMPKRRDALAGAARMITALQDIGGEADDKTRITVGQLTVHPNSGSTIPGEVYFTIDLRHPDSRVLEEIQDRISATIKALAAQNDLEVLITEKMAKQPTQFDHRMIALIQQTTNRLGLPHMQMISGAGHDAVNLAMVTPTAMIFVPCKNGVSHNEQEYATAEDLASGTEVLLHVLLDRAIKVA